MNSKVAQPIDALVRELPEVYQPIYGHCEFSSLARRPSLDRLAAVAAVHDELRRTLCRPVRVLDLGCAQGFFSLSLAARGAKVHGIDNLAQNIKLCQALAATAPASDVCFKLTEIDIAILELKPDEHDLVLALSAFHHICHARGQEATRALLGSLATKVPTVVYEPALCSEPLYWAAAQAKRPRDLLADFAFVTTLGEHPTHLSDIKRPLLFCSNKYWYLGGRVQAFTSWTDQQHEVAGNAFGGTRRYYFSEAQIAKYFLLEEPLTEANRKEIESEISFLSGPAPKPKGWPHLIACGIEADAAWLVRELVPGERLSELIMERRPYDPVGIVRSVLGELATLQASGLYHNDVRTWNIILRPDGEATLIDYGSITALKSDVVWPHDVFLSFLLFVRELVAGGIPKVAPTRAPLLSPQHLSEPLRSWAVQLWSKPRDAWSFKSFKDELEAHLVGKAANAQQSPRPAASTAHLPAIEQNIEIIGEQQQMLWQEMERLSAQTIQSQIDRTRFQEAMAQVLEKLAALKGETAGTVALADALEASRTRIAELDAQVASHRAAAAAVAVELTAERQRHDLEKRDTDQRIEALRVELDQLVSEHRHQTAALLDANQRIETLTVERDQLAAECQQHAGAIHDASQRIEALIGSTSWRVTKPMRAMSSNGCLCKTRYCCLVAFCTWKPSTTSHTPIDRLRSRCTRCSPLSGRRCQANIISISFAV